MMAQETELLIQLRGAPDAESMYEALIAAENQVLAKS